MKPSVTEDLFCCFGSLYHCSNTSWKYCKIDAAFLTLCSLFFIALGWHYYERGILYMAFSEYWLFSIYLRTPASLLPVWARSFHPDYRDQGKLLEFTSFFSLGNDWSYDAVGCFEYSTGSFVSFPRYVLDTIYSPDNIDSCSNAEFN